MHELAFRIVNVFTQNAGRLTGNPLCVFENATSLDTATMQALARQFNLSETTFVLPSSRATAQVRIFTPSYEMQFAGHPTLGTAHVCRALGLGGDDLKLDMQAGIIPVKAKGDRWTLQANAPSWRACEASRAKLAKMLGLTESDIGREPLWVKAGKEQLIVPLTSERAVRNVRPDASTFADVLNEDGQSMAYVFAELAQPERLLSRFFFPVGSAVLEDPATGSATANLGGWMIATGRRLPSHFEISQGEYAGRPSTLLLDVDGDGQIFVSGDVIELARGTLQV
ncbi:MAG TPA: PhzF family phenazine biosynthesis protein [Steroidobacteraceae bacterium]|jgi:trans-2,3-dihydro-3-hydroxyanthranilate isomerase|nr:PhzF family phenazine biosynthesis protein [Steroidobacteraceae bacterium]